MPLSKEAIDDAVVDILTTEGPDGHCDGHEALTAFVLAVQEDRADEWIKTYQGKQSVLNRKNIL